jgi:negative regulator of sigma E activity
MNTKRHVPLREALRQAASLPEPRPAQEFWQDFRARAALTMQEVPERVVGSRLASLRWAVAAAALLVLVCGVALLVRSGAGTTRVAQAPVPKPAGLSTVEEVEVFSEYSSVMIVEDSENGGTVIWVASADTGRLP